MYQKNNICFLHSLLRYSCLWALLKQNFMIALTREKTKNKLVAIQTIYIDLLMSIDLFEVYKIVF